MPYIAGGDEKMYCSSGSTGVPDIRVKEINGYGGLVSPAGVISEFFAGVPGASAVLMLFVAGGPTVVPATGVSSYGVKSFAKANTAATASTTANIALNGSNVGTIVWGIAGTVATITIASQINMVAGDILRVTGPASADATLKDIAISLAVQF